MCVTDGLCADTSLSKAIGQTAKYCDDVYLHTFPQPAAIVFELLRTTRLVRVIGGASVRSRVRSGGERVDQILRRADAARSDAVASKLGWP